MHTCVGMLDEGSIVHSAVIHRLVTSYIAAIDLPTLLCVLHILSTQRIEYVFPYIEVWV